MKPVATRDFAIQVTPGAEMVDDEVRGLVSGIFEVRLNWQVDFTFIPFEPGMAPPSVADSTRWKGVEAWRTPADARLEFFYHSQYVITGCYPLAGGEFRYLSQYGATVINDVRHANPWKPENSIVFYTSTDQYKVLTADLEKFLETHSGWNREECALDLRGRPVVDFLVDRLPTSRLVSDEMLYWLGLERAVIPLHRAPSTSRRK